MHNHSTKIRSHSYFLIYSFLHCADISFGIFKAVLPLYFGRSVSVVLLYFVRYIHSSTMFPTLYSWKCCSYISYAISTAICLRQLLSCFHAIYVCSCMLDNLHSTDAQRRVKTLSKVEHGKFYKKYVVS